MLLKAVFIFLATCFIVMVGSAKIRCYAVCVQESKDCVNGDFNVTIDNTAQSCVIVKYPEGYSYGYWNDTDLAKNCKKTNCKSCKTDLCNGSI